MEYRSCSNKPRVKDISERKKSEYALGIKWQKITGKSVSYKNSTIVLSENIPII